MPESAPAVSVIIPYYHGEAYLGQAVDSILNQSYESFEIVVVDDGSSEESRRFAERLCDKSGIRLITHETNRGIAAARNTGLRESNGRFVAFLDQDDTWHPHKLEMQVAVLEGSDTDAAGFVFADLEILNELGRKPRRRLKRAPAGIANAPRLERLRQYVNNNYIPIVTALIRRECIEAVGGFNEDIRSGVDDSDLFFRLMLRYRFAHIPEPLARRRLHRDNYTSIEKMVPDTMRMLGRVLEQEPALEPCRRPRLARLYDDLGDAVLLRGGSAEARVIYRRSMKLGRRHISTYLGYLLACGGGAGRWLAKTWLRFRLGR